MSLGYLAARTQRLELGVSALVVPQRNPLVALKQLATLDLLSGGRIVTAVAAGWMEGEFALLGADFERRGRLLDEWLDLARACSSRCRGASPTRVSSSRSTAGSRRRSFVPAGRSCGWPGCRARRCDGRRARECGTRSRSPGRAAPAGRRAARATAGQPRRPAHQRPARSRARGGARRARPPRDRRPGGVGGRAARRSTSRPAATASS